MHNESHVHGTYYYYIGSTIKYYNDEKMFTQRYMFLLIWALNGVISLFDHWTRHEALANVDLSMGRHRRRRASIHTAERQRLLFTG